MARKTRVLTIEREGRDKGKKFVLTEMSSRRAEEWGNRLLLALSKSGADVPPDMLDMGMAGIASMALHALGGVSWEVAKPLLDEMMECVQVRHGGPDSDRRLMENDNDGDDIQEVATRYEIREALLELHTGFSVAGTASRFWTYQQERAAGAADVLLSGSDTPTSPNPSDASSPPASLG